MSRWGSDTYVRLEQAALELYLERGFEQTTVAEIAQRAGLTERTFFRYFTDKREVLFGGAGLFQELIGRAVSEAPESASTLEAVVIGLEAAKVVFQENAERSRQRQTIITAHPELQARESSKLTALAATITEALRGRGVADPVARLAAEAGIVIFRAAFEHWIGDTEPREWSHLLRQSLEDFRAVMAGA